MTNNVKSKDFKSCCTIAFIVLTYIVLFFNTIIIFVYSATWGFIFLAIILLVKFIPFIKKNRKTKGCQSINNNSINKIIAKSNNSNNYISLKNKVITKNYFDDVTSIVEQIIDFLNNLSTSNKFISYYKSQNNNIHISIDGNEADETEQLKILLLSDLVKCITDLGHNINLKSKEGFGLCYYLCRTHGLSKFKYDKLPTLLNNEAINPLEKLANQVAITVNNCNKDGNKFMFSKLLEDYDLELCKKYLILLYRYASLTAKADGNVTETEANWLSDILKESQHPLTNGNVNYTNFDTEQSSDKTTKTIRNTSTSKKLKSLIGLNSVKTEIDTLTNFIKIQKKREEKGLKKSNISYHCVFTGNPGTGKTTVARIVAEIYKNLGVVSKGHLVETDRSGLVAEYVGQTAVKTNKIIDSALDGVLFIDEAYSLISDSQCDYGKEAIATLLKRMEDDRDRLIVILAGYSAEMKQFIDSNPGLQSRFNRYIEFPDYSAEELYCIFEKTAKDFDYELSKSAVQPLKDYLSKAVTNKDKNFGNARFIRNLFEKTIERQSNRLSKEIDLTEDKLTEIQITDLSI